MIVALPLTEFYFHRLIKKFRPEIKRLFTTRTHEYIPMLLTTSNVLTEQQIDYVCQEIENQREVNDRGSKENILTEVILPEFIIYVFSNKFQMSRVDAIDRLKIQEERQTLFTESYGDL